MNDTTRVIALINAALKSCGKNVVFQETFPSAIYPRICFEIKQIGGVSQIQSYSVGVDLWARETPYSALHAKLDLIESKICGYTCEDFGTVWVENNLDRLVIPDSDKTIQHIRQTFTLKACFVEKE